MAGIVGAGGNVGAVAAGFLIEGRHDHAARLLVLGVIVTASAACALAVRFTAQKLAERRAYEDAIAAREANASDQTIAGEGALVRGHREAGVSVS